MAFYFLCILNGATVSLEKTQKLQTGVQNHPKRNIKLLALPLLLPKNRNKMSGLLTDFFMQGMTNPLWWAKLGLLFVNKIL